MRSLIIAAVTTLSISAQAQEMVAGAEGTTFGLRAGVNFQNINGKNAAGGEQDNGVTTGFHGGVNAEVPLGSGFFLQPGLLYSTKGAEVKATDNKVSLGYLELPVNFIYKPLVGTGNVLLGFGPYAGFAISGKTVVNDVEKKIDFDAAYNAADMSTHYEKFDAGANFLVGYEFANKFSAQFNAQLGLININKDDPSTADEKTTAKNTGFGVSLGYRF